MSTNWQVVYDLRLREQEEAKIRVQESRLGEQKTLASLNQVLSFLGEYKLSLSQLEAEGAPIATIIRTRAAIKQLAESAAQQEQLLVRLSFVLQQNEKHLVECSAKLRAAEKLQDNAVQSQRRLRQVAEAKELDEMARRQYMANLST